MAYTAGNLHLRAAAPGDLSYTYDATADTLATVATAGYFNNEDDDLNLTVDDLIWCQCPDGNMWQRVSAIDSGSAVTTQFAGGNIPVQTFATGTAAALNTLLVGYYEVGTSIATATRMVLPVVYPGAEVIVTKVDTGTAILEFDAGGSGATAVYYGPAAATQRQINIRFGRESFHVVGSSTSRWRIQTMDYHGTGGSAAGTDANASLFLGGT